MFSNYQRKCTSLSHEQSFGMVGVCLFCNEITTIVVFQDKGYSVYTLHSDLWVWTYEQQFIRFIQDWHKQCLHFYLEHGRESQMTNLTNDYFWAKQAQGHICLS